MKYKDLTPDELVIEREKHFERPEGCECGSIHGFRVRVYCPIHMYDYESLPTDPLENMYEEEVGA